MLNGINNAVARKTGRAQLEYLTRYPECVVRVYLRLYNSRDVVINKRLLRKVLLIKVNLIANICLSAYFMLSYLNVVCGEAISSQKIF